MKSVLCRLWIWLSFSGSALCCLLSQVRAQDKNKPSRRRTNPPEPLPVPPLAGGTAWLCSVAGHCSCQTGPPLSCLFHPPGHLLCLFCDNVSFLAPQRPPGLDAQTIPLTVISVFVIIIFSPFFFLFIYTPPSKSIW